MIDIALHCDEQGSDHIHERLIFCGKNSHGEVIASKAAAFKSLGIQRPDMSKPENRNNCPLQTFTKMCRDMFIETCIEHGITIDQEVKEYSSKSGLSTLQYKIQKEQEQEQNLKNDISKLEELQNKNITFCNEWKNSTVQKMKAINNKVSEYEDFANGLQVEFEKTIFEQLGNMPEPPEINSNAPTTSFSNLDDEELDL